MQRRHGDLLLEKISKLPEGLKKRPQPVLAYGETTGHYHGFEDPSKVAVFEDDGGGVFFEVTEPVALFHQEHNKTLKADGTLADAPQVVEVGVWKVVRKREYSPSQVRSILD